MDLVRRVDALERGFAATAQGAAPNPASRTPGRVVPAVASVAPVPAPRTRTVVPMLRGRATAAQQAAGAEQAQAEAAPGGQPSGLGALKVDEEAAERALERSLTQVGALLLDFGKMEVEPSFTYTRRDQEGPLLVAVGADTVVTTSRLRSDELEGAAAVRIGLPWDTQVEASVPYRREELSIVSQAAGASGTSSVSEQSTSANGLGDVRVGLAKTLFRERGWRPDLIARVEWDSDTGQTNNGLPLGTGFDEITGSLTGLKRQDPLAFVGRFAYRSAFERNGIEPGDELQFSLGAILAASPDTSLSATLEQTFDREIRVNGQDIPGSDEVSSVFALGASSILGPGVLLTVSGGIGLTPDAPDYFVTASVPVRFGYR